VRNTTGGSRIPPGGTGEEKGGGQKRSAEYAPAGSTLVEKFPGGPRMGEGEEESLACSATGITVPVTQGERDGDRVDEIQKGR